MSQYKGYYTAGSSRGVSQEADNRFGGRGESQEQDCTEYDKAGDDDGTEYDNAGDNTEYDPGGTTAMFDSRQPWRSSIADHGKRGHDEADLHNGRRAEDQVSFGVITLNASPTFNTRFSNI